MFDVTIEWALNSSRVFRIFFIDADRSKNPFVSCSVKEDLSQLIRYAVSVRVATYTLGYLDHKVHGSVRRSVSSLIPDIATKVDSGTPAYVMTVVQLPELMIFVDCHLIGQFIKNSVVGGHMFCLYDSGVDNYSC